MLPCTNLDNKNPRFAGILEPSDGLEPSTPSLPSWDERGTRGHTRVTAGTKAPQTRRTRRRRVTRAWTRVDGLMFAPRSHGMSSVWTTSSREASSRSGRRTGTAAGMGVVLDALDRCSPRQSAWRRGRSRSHVRDWCGPVNLGSLVSTPARGAELRTTATVATRARRGRKSLRRVLANRQYELAFPALRTEWAEVLDAV